MWVEGAIKKREKGEWIGELWWGWRFETRLVTHLEVNRWMFERMVV